MIRRVGIVGASGEMGGVLARYATQAGQEVRPLGRPLTPEKLSSALAGCDLVLLSVPIPAMETTLAMVAPHLDGQQILADACSVKCRPLEQMLAAYGGPVVGTHPLFGANLPAPPDRRVVVCPGRGTTAEAQVTAWIASLGFQPFAATAQDHDRSMAMIQGLNYVTTVAYLACLARQPDIERYVTPSFARRLQAARKMITCDAALFEAIYEANPESLETVRRYSAYLSVASGGDVNLLSQRAAWWWREPALADALATSFNHCDPRE